MSFRKRNLGLTGPSSKSEQKLPTDSSSLEDASSSTQSPGIRPSPVDGRSTTSTGTKTLDDLLAGHAGLALGNSLLLEENGTTDFAVALLRYFAAEGVVQGQKVHVVGVGEQWGRELPGLAGATVGEGRDETGHVADKEKMKIAWRYERLGEFGSGHSGSRAPPIPNRQPQVPSHRQPEHTVPPAFCHTFDLTKRLSLPTSDAVNFIPISGLANDTFSLIIQSIAQIIAKSEKQTIHRLIIPSLLSPALYPPAATDPKLLLPFFHSLRALLHQHSQRITAMITLPLFLYPRSSGLVCWIERLSDGVLELAPFPHSVDIEPPLTTSTSASKSEEKPQGMLKIHKLPVLTEKGGGSGGGNDLAFSLTRKRFTIKPFSLPPVEGDQEAQRGDAGGEKDTKDIEF